MAIEENPYEALLRMEQMAGSQSELARMMGVSQNAVWKWLQSSKRLPAEHVLKASELFGIAPYVLRPDIYPRNLPTRFYGVDQNAGFAA